MTELKTKSQIINDLELENDELMEYVHHLEQLLQDQSNEKEDILSRMDVLGEHFISLAERYDKKDYLLSLHRKNLDLQVKRDKDDAEFLKKTMKEHCPSCLNCGKSLDKKKGK